MPTLNLGRVGFVNKGTWLISTAYKINDTVTYLGGTYACLIANTGQTPILGGTIYWQEWVSEDTVHKSGTETITGAKTFSISPIIPTPADGDNSTKTASTAFVASAIPYNIAAATAKTTPVDADKFGIWDSVSGLLNSVSLLNFKNTIFSSKPPSYNYIINGNFDIWDYGTSGTTTVGVATYTANRWIITSTGVGAPWAKQPTDKSGQYGLQVAGTAGLTGVTYIQRVESLLGRRASGKSVTIQYKIYSPDIRTITYSSKTADVIDVFSTITQKHTGTINVIAGWNVGSFTIPVLDATSYRGFDIEFQCGALTSGNLAIAQVQLEEGSIATPWSPYNGEFGGEVQACQRYLPAYISKGTSHPISMGQAASTTLVEAFINFPVKTRVPPTGFVLSNTTHLSTTGSATVGSGTASINIVSDTIVGLRFTTGSLTTNGALAVYFNNASAYLYFTGCEL